MMFFIIEGYFILLRKGVVILLDVSLRVYCNVYMF